jgi:hypothetical protein
MLRRQESRTDIGRWGKAMIRRSTICCFAVLVGWLASAKAHHSAAVHFLTDQEISVTGKVEEFRFSNPHSVIFVTAQNAQGEAQVWAIEWAGASSLLHRGLTRNTFTAGDTVTILGSPARDGSRTMIMRGATFADGRPPITRSARRDAADDRE